MYIKANSTDLTEMFPIFLLALLGIGLILWLIYFFIKKQDEKKPLQTQKIRVLEKTMQQGNVAWYIVECENGERMKLRSFQGNSLFLSVGDTGTITYRGQTIQSFQKQV